MEYEKYCISQNSTIREAMRQLDKTAKRVVYITEEKRLIASLTDGDVRRWLLSGGKMEDKAIAAANRTPRTATTRADAHRLLSQMTLLTSVPVVNENMEITAIAFGNEPDDSDLPSLKIPVVVMAGGKGTRLEPYTHVLPKPLIPVGELPILEHIMGKFLRYGCDDFHVVVNHKKQLIKAYFAECEQRYNIDWYDETEALGTGGGLYLLKNTIKETFFLTNCDVLLQSDYDDILAFHHQSGNAVTMVCAYKNVLIPYGVVDIGENGIIESMREKPELCFLTNTGIYIVEPEVLADIEDGVAIGFPDIIEKQREKGRKVSVYPVKESDWFDMGQLSGLEEMRGRLYGKE